MKIVRLQCPACGADITVTEPAQPLTCSYCGTRLAVDDGGPQLALAAAPEPAARPAAAHSAPPSLPSPSTAPTVPPALRPAVAAQPLGVSDGRGCLAAVLIGLFLGPLLAFLLALPAALLLPSDAAGHVQMPDVLAGCYGLLFFLLPPILAVYAFFYFRERRNSVKGFFTAPFGWLRRHTVVSAGGSDDSSY